MEKMMGEFSKNKINWNNNGNNVQGTTNVNFSPTHQIQKAVLLCTILPWPQAIFYFASNYLSLVPMCTWTSTTQLASHFTIIYSNYKI